MLIGGVLLGFVLGMVLGGRLEHLADIRLRFLPLLFIAVIVRFGTELAIGAGVGIADQLRLPLFVGAYGLLLFSLWHNRGYPGLALAFVGVASNALAVLANGGRMPVWVPSLVQAGFRPEDLSSVFHVQIAGTGADFLLHLGPLSDIIPIPFEPIRNVASIGDMFLTAGLAFFLFATLIRAPAELRAAIEEVQVGRRLGLAGTARLPGLRRRPPEAEPGEPTGLGVPAGTGLSSGLSETAALERPLVMGAGGVGMASPALAPLPANEDRLALMTAAGATAIAGAPAGTLELPGIAFPRPTILTRARQHPYVRLAQNGSFSALWAGQVISLFGDRVNQIALAAFVYAVTDSALAVGLVFLTATVPNLLFSPIAGAFVDRWENKQVLVVSDLLRAAFVLLIPVAVLIDVWLAYPLVFLITTVSIFFRPARIAILPRIVRDEDLLPANSALWVGETLADVVNYPLAGLFVVFLAGSLPMAFWFDAATYLASAALLATMVVPPLVARVRGVADDVAVAHPEPGSAAGGPAVESVSSIRRDMQAGWAFLRHEAVLLANTLQGALGQFAIGIVTVTSPILALQVLTPGDEWKATYAFMETAIGVGNLVGGFLLGLVTARIPRGRLVIAGYTAFGLLLVGLGVTSSVPVVLGILFGVGIANIAFVIPSQTLFQERTPPELMGRVVSFRFALVFGSMSVAMAVAGIFSDAVGPGPVILAAGVLSTIAGLGGLLFRSVRDA